MAKSNVDGDFLVSELRKTQKQWLRQAAYKTGNDLVDAALDQCLMNCIQQIERDIKSATKS